MNTLLRQISLVAAAALALSSTASFAIDPGACCAPQTSRVDALMNPVVGGDERFFSATGSPTTVMFLVGTYQTMRDYVNPLPTGGSLGCSTAAHITAMKVFYDKTDPSKNGLTPIDADTALPTRFFEPTQFYASTTTKVREGSGSFDSFNTSDFTRVNPIGTDATTACAAAGLGLTAAQKLTCVACVNTVTGPGWFRKDDNNWLLGGPVLNANPPKFVTTRAVVKEVAASLSNVRIGFSAFNAGTGDFYDPPRIPVRASPACSALNPIDSTAVLASVKTSINSLAFTGSERQIGEALFGIGGYFSTKTQWQTWFDIGGSFTPPSNYPGASGWINSTNAMWTANTGSNTITWGAGEEMCSACQQTMVIVLTDGTPDQDNSVPESKMMTLLINQGARRPDNTLLNFSANSGGSCPNTSTSGGINFCDRFSSTKCACDTVSGPVGPDTGNKNFMDDVAFFLANMDLRPDLAGKQTVKTYTIGLGDNSPMLQSIAYAGGGLFYSANNAAQLKSAVIAAITDVQSKTTGFSGASVAAVQTGSSEAILPRLFPRSGKPWLGSLWRFQIYSEFVEGVSITDGGLNNEVMIDDAGVVVTEDLTTGTFVKQGSAIAADKFWEAGEQLVALGHKNRSMWTVRDDQPSGGDGAFTAADTMVEFKMANRTILKQYLGVLGTPFCPVAAGSSGILLNSLGLTASALATAINANYVGTVVATPTTQSELDDLCVAGLILYIRGADLADEDGDANRSETRRSVLADIFHSTPVSVVPPVDPFLCDLGIVNQCVRTLYSKDLGGIMPTDQAADVNVPDCQSTPVNVPRAPYEAWAYRSRKRQKTVLVGSNDGVLHAFANGTATETCPNGNPDVVYNQGTGQEIWGFIPPDQLSRLQDQLSGHTYGVDGDVMVRDIWADASGSGPSFDGIKQEDEFHTIAIAAEGRGGTHYFALEVDYNVVGGIATTVKPAPKFLWMFPQPCSEESASFGKTLNSLSPKPPAIGPVLTRAPTTAGSKPRYGFDTRETWVAAISGGWSPGRERGRGIYVVDAYRGQVNGRRDNLWWKFEFDDNPISDMSPTKKLGQSVASPVAMVDYGSNSDPRQDGFFDTAVFGDVQGQLWVARMFEPAQVDTSAPFLVSNWRGGRAFEMDRDGVPSAPGIDVDGDLDDDPDPRYLLNRHPFYYLPSVVIEPGTNLMRAFIGTGDRYSILDAPNPVCRFDNPVACAKAQCNDIKIRYRFDGPATNNVKLETRFKKRQFSAGKYDVSLASNPVCGIPGTDNVDARFEHYKVRQCSMTNATVIDPAATLNDSHVKCQQNAASSSYSCNYTASPTVLTQDLLNQSITDVAGLGKNRYIGVLVYGNTSIDGGSTRTFVEGNGSATTFDNGRLTDRGDLVDVSTTACTGTAGGPMTCTGPTANTAGWFLDYDVQTTKTATGSAVLASCVLFNTLTPATGGGSSCVAGAGSPEARLVQANFLTGAPDCADGFLDGGVSQRYLARNVVSSPPEPASSIQISKSGQIKMEVKEPDPGNPTSVSVTNGQDVLQLVYELPISRAMHDCRHNDGGCVVVP